MIAAGTSLPDILTKLCLAIDEQNPDMMSMVMLMDPDGQGGFEPLIANAPE
jgi:hypothetical protein